MMKKELATQQRRTSEAMALQRHAAPVQQRLRSTTEQPPQSPQLLPPASPLAPLDTITITTTTNGSSNNKVMEQSPRRNPAAVSATVQAEMDRMDRILAEHASGNSPSLAAVTTSTTTTTAVATSEKEQPPQEIVAVQVLPKLESAVLATPTASPSKSADVSEGEDEDDDEEEDDVEEPITKRQTRVADLPIMKNGRSPGVGEPFVATAGAADGLSSPFKRKENYNEEFPGDISVVRNKGRRHPTKKLDNNSLGDFKETDDESSVQSGSSAEQATNGGGGNFERVKNAEDKSTMSSIDAFEASFQTNFPDSFSPREDAEEKKTSESGIYNPFAPSPKKSPQHGSSSAGATATTDRPWASNKVSSNDGTRERASVAARRMESRRSSGPAAASIGPKQSPKIGTPTASPATMSKPAVAVLLDSPQVSVKASFVNSSPVSRRSTVVASPISTPTPTTSSNSPFVVLRSSSPVGNSPLVALRSSSPVGNSPVVGLRSNSPVTQRYSPSTPQQQVFAQGASVRAKFNTPSPPLFIAPASTPPSESDKNQQPKRPEKAGYDAARARYEKALKPRGPSVYDKGIEVANARDISPAIDERSKPPMDISMLSTVAGTPLEVTGLRTSVKDRAAVFSESPRTQENDTARRGSWSSKGSDNKPYSYSPATSDTEDGDIPMNSTLSAKKSERPVNTIPSISPVTYRVIGTVAAANAAAAVASPGTSNEIQNALTRLRPWDSASTNSSIGQPPLSEEREFGGKQRRNVNGPVGDEYTRYRRDMPKQDAAGIGTQ